MRFHEPMSAKNFEDNDASVVYPCFVQPKLDGVRCVTDGRRFWSRNGKRFPDKNIAHLKTTLALPYLVDGELMIPDRPFEESVSALKHASSDDRSASLKLRFFVFDVMTKSVFRTRNSQTAETIQDVKKFFGAPKWILVQTYLVQSRPQLDVLFKRILRSGHEGVMVRNMLGFYASKRSIDLLKWKPLLDREYTVAAVKEAKGKDKGTPIFICQVGLQRFRVRPMGTMAQRRAMWKDRTKLIGQKLTVEYQNLTKYGVPRFPRAKVFRNYE